MWLVVVIVESRIRPHNYSIIPHSQLTHIAFITTLQNFHIDNLDILLRFLLIDTNILDPMDDVHTSDGATENSMFLVQPWGLLGCDEELRAVGIRACVSHTDRVRLVMLERRKLVDKFGAPDAFAPGTVAEGVAALSG